jgi:membrane protease YdiL (CAAX protease family)
LDDHNEKIFMNNLPINENGKWLFLSVVYALVLLLLMSIINYALPYSPGPVTTPEAWQLAAWGLLYLPVLFLPLMANRNISELGFTISPYMLLGLALIGTLCTLFNSVVGVSWMSAGTEAFARTGEELFFRGFLFDIFLKMFTNKRGAWLWAALASSLLFTLVHTQTFQPSFLSQYGSASAPAFHKIIERLVNVFCLALIFALLRAWTGSILPGAVAHSILSAGILTIPFVLLIYLVVILWAFLRGERITFGTQPQPASDENPAPALK